MWITLLIFIILSLHNIAYAEISNLEIAYNKANFSAENDFMIYTIGDSSIQFGHYQRYAQGISFKEKEKGFEYFTGRVYEYPDEEKRNLLSKPKAKYLTKYYFAVADNSDEDGAHYFYIDSTDKENKKENIIFGTRYVNNEFTTSIGSEFDKNTKALTGSSIYNKFEHKRLRIENYFSTVNSEVTDKKSLYISQDVIFKTIKTNISSNFIKGRSTYQISSYKKIFDFNIRHTITKSDKVLSTLMVDKYFNISDFNNSISFNIQTNGNYLFSTSIEKDLGDDEKPITTSFYSNIARQNHQTSTNFYLSISDEKRLLSISYEERSLTLRAGIRVFKISGESGYLSANIQNNKVFFGISI
jgi:hypothetical protein